MTFHLRHLSLGFGLAVVFQGGIESMAMMPSQIRFFVIFLSTFIYSLFLYQLCSFKVLRDMVKAENQTNDDIYLFLRKKKTLPRKSKSVIYGEITVLLCLYIFAFIEYFKIKGSVGSTILSIGISLSIFGCSYLYFLTRRSLFLSLMETE